jgi:hypothetical protein|tara:strand:+ start:165 stop:338 length:174 start_codon:yes stop_codon:yes gene_type:complete
MKTRPGIYKKSQQYIFEMNKVILRTHLNTFIGICGVPDENNNERLQKTDCHNVVSDH